MGPALADSESALSNNQRGLAYDISWPQCPDNMPPGDFDFAVIGLNNGRPFTNNPCFEVQYRWAQIGEPHPDVYINVDFPRAGRAEALTGPYGRCEETDDWCRGYNWGYNSGKDALERIRAWGITPDMVWMDVEVDNHWSNSPRNNGQVVRGMLDYMVEFNVPVGIYGTRYQWDLITGGYQAPFMIPLWVAGARNAEEAFRRCDNNTNLAFAGGIIWLSQYYPEGVWDGNVICPAAEQAIREVAAPSAEPVAPPEAKVAEATAPASASAAPASDAAATPVPVSTLRAPVMPQVANLLKRFAPWVRN